jgi:hypothetical protein
MLRSWCHFKARNVNFKKTSRSRCIDVPNKSYGAKYPTIGGRIISAHLVGLGLGLGLGLVLGLQGAKIIGLPTVRYI